MGKSAVVKEMPGHLSQFVLPKIRAAAKQNKLTKSTSLSVYNLALERKTMVNQYSQCTIKLTKQCGSQTKVKMTPVKRHNVATNTETVPMVNTDTLPIRLSKHIPTKLVEQTKEESKTNIQPLKISPQEIDYDIRDGAFHVNTETLVMVHPQFKKLKNYFAE